MTLRRHWRGGRACLPAVAAAIAASALAAPPAPPPPVDTRPDGQWRGNAGSAVTYTTGNTRNTSISLNADLARATLQDRIGLSGGVIYGHGEVNGVSQTTSQKWNANARYDYNLGPTLLVFGKFREESDKMIFLSSRTALDAGLGWKLIDTDNNKFTVFGGGGYSLDRYSMPQTIDGRTQERFQRASLAFAEESFHRLTPTVRFKQRLEVNPAIGGDHVTLSKFGAGLEVAMTQTLSLTVDVADSYNSRPAVGVLSNDFSLFTGVSVRFGAP